MATKTFDGKHGTTYCLVQGGARCVLVNDEEPGGQIMVWSLTIADWMVVSEVKTVWSTGRNRRGEGYIPGFSLAIEQAVRIADGLDPIPAPAA